MKNQGKGQTQSFFLFMRVCMLVLFVEDGRSLVLAQSISATESLIRQYPDSAYVLIKNRLALASQQHDQRMEGDYLHQLGQLFYHQGSYARATSSLLQASKIFQQTNQPDQLARTLNDLGTVYYYNRQPMLARKQFDNALRLYRQTRNGAGIAQTYGRIGQIYEKKPDLDSASYYQKRALASYKSIRDSVGIAKIYENLGSIFEDQARYDSAQHYFRQALHLNELNQDAIAQIEIIDNLGDLFRKTGRYQQALSLYRQARQLASQKQEKYQLNSVYRDLAKTYSLLHQPDSAYYYLELSHDLVDEIYTIENNKQIALLQTLYEVEQKNNEIVRLNAAKRIDLILIAAVVVVLLLMGILAVVIISRQRLKIRNEQAINEQNKQIFETQHELMQAELKNKILQEESLKDQLTLKSKSLSTHTLHLIQKNQLLEELKNELTTLVNDDKRDQKKQLRQLVQKINLSFSQDEYWEEFRVIFDQVHQQFVSRITQEFPSLTAYDLRLIALLKMNINSADTATLLGITPDSLRVTRYRLRKKLNLAEGDSLSGFVQQFS